MNKRFNFATATLAALILVCSHGSNAQQQAIPVGWYRLGMEWLVQDRSYEDVGVRLSYKCGNCENGVLFMENTSKPAQGTYVSLAKADAGSTYRITLDSNGHEVDRQPIVSEGQ